MASPGAAASPSPSRSPAAPTVAAAAASRMAPSFGSATASRSATHWAVLDRKPKFVHAVDASSSSYYRDYAVTVAAPPGVSSLQLARAVIPLRDIPDLEARVECADAAGNILISLDSPTAGFAGPDLLVCCAGTGRVDVLPRIVPDDHQGVLCFGPESLSSTGILPHAGFTVVQLQCSAAASSSSARHLALRYSSSSSSWTSHYVEAKYPPRLQANDGGSILEEIQGEQEEEIQGEQGAAFSPDTVISHEDGKHLVFVDINRGVLLLFDAMRPCSPPRLLALPDSGREMEGDVKEAAKHRCVSCAHGTICLLEMRDHTVTMSLLDGQFQWSTSFRVFLHEVFLNKDCIIGHPPLLSVLGHVDPTKLNTFSVYVPDAGMGFKAFEVAVDPKLLFLERVHVCEPVSAGNNTGSCLEVVVWRFSPADPAAAATTRLRGRRLVLKLVHRVKWVWKTGRKHVGKVETVAKAAAMLGVPYASSMVAVASRIATLSNAADTGEEIGAHIRERLSGNRQMVVRAVGNTEEAEEIIKEWAGLGKPSNWAVKPAPELDQPQVDALRQFFINYDAKALVWMFSDYVMVGNALDF